MLKQRTKQNLVAARNEFITTVYYNGGNAIAGAARSAAERLKRGVDSRKSRGNNRDFFVR